MLGPWFGAVVDRHDRRRVLMLAEAGLGVVALGYSAAAALGALDLPALLMLATVWGLINALDTPARRSLVPQLVPPERAASAAALSGTVMLAGMAAGTAVGAWLVGAAGVSVTFAINAGSFAVDLLVLATLRTGPSPRVPRAAHQVREGLRYVARTPELGAAMLGIGIVAVFSFAIQVTVPLLARRSFDGGPDLIGTLLFVTTAGGLAGTLAIAALGSSSPAVLSRSALILAAGLLGTALSPETLLAGVALAVVGFGWSCLIGAAIARLQNADPRLLGRVMSLFSVVLLGGNTLGAPVAAALGDALGPRAPFFVGAAAAVFAAMVLASFGSSRTPGATPEAHPYACEEFTCGYADLASQSASTVSRRGSHAALVNGAGSSPPHRIPRRATSSSSPRSRRDRVHESLTALMRKAGVR